MTSKTDLWNRKLWDWVGFDGKCLSNERNGSLQLGCVPFKLREQNAIESIISINLIRPLSVWVVRSVILFSFLSRLFIVSGCMRRKITCVTRERFEAITFLNNDIFHVSRFDRKAHWIYLYVYGGKQFLSSTQNRNKIKVKKKHTTTTRKYLHWNLEVVYFNNENWFHVEFCWCFWSRRLFVNAEKNNIIWNKKLHKKV